MSRLRREHRIFVAGHRGLVGSALVRVLEEGGYRNLLTRTRDELDLSNAKDVRCFFEATRPDCVFLAAARVGGIVANDRFPLEFLTDNLAIAQSVLVGAHETGVGRVVFLGSSCIYPKHAPQPIREGALLSGPLEPTNRAYAIAKIAGLELVHALRRQHGRDYFSVMPTNLYGPGDNYDPELSHFVPGLIRRAHRAKVEGAKELVVWGTGSPQRDLMFSLDAARAIVLLAERYPEPGGSDESECHVNVGSGTEHSIRAIAAEICRVVGFSGALRFDPSRPDGTPRKLLDVSYLRSLDFALRTGIGEGLRVAYEDALRRGVL